MVQDKKSQAVRRLTFAALLMALNIAASSFSINLPFGHLYCNDIVISFASLVLSPISAFAVAGFGAFLGDLLFYPTPMFVSLVTRGLEGLLISLLARKIPGKEKRIAAIIGLIVGVVITNVGYTIGRAFIYSTPAYAIAKLPWEIVQSSVGAVLAYILYFHVPFFAKLRESGEAADDRS